MKDVIETLSSCLQETNIKKSLYNELTDTLFISDIEISNIISESDEFIWNNQEQNNSINTSWDANPNNSNNFNNNNNKSDGQQKYIDDETTINSKNKANKI